MDKTQQNTKAGFTLIELVVAIAFFSLLMGALYGTFNAIGDIVTKTSNENSLSDKGQRILSFMEDDLLMIGYLLPPEGIIPFCVDNAPPGSASTNSNLITFSDSDPFDSLTFITAEPIQIKETVACRDGQKDADNVARMDGFLTTVGTNLRCSNDNSVNCNVDADCGAGNTCSLLSKVQVDAAAGCYSDNLTAVDGNENGRSLVTFELPDKTYYTLASLGNYITMTQSVDRRIQDNATVYGLRQYSYQVDTTAGIRNLRRIGWDSACSTAGDMIANLATTNGTANNSGGVDAIQYEFTSIDTNTGQLIHTRSLPEIINLKHIKIWLLLRADKPEKNYKNTNTYTLGTPTAGFYSNGAALVLGPYNDNYRRVLVSKIVEVRNLAPISH